MYDEKRQAINIGDKITFQCENESIEAEVVGLSCFASFVNLFKTLGGVSAGWKSSDTPISMSNDMRKYYSEEKEKYFGVLGIHFRLAK